MEFLFNAIGLFLFLLAALTLLVIFRDSFAALNLDDKETFRGWMGRKMAVRVHAINSVWNEHRRSYPDSRKRVMFVFLLVGSVMIVAGYQLFVFLNRSAHLAYVDSAIGSTRALVNAENLYAKTHPGTGYTCTLSALPMDASTAELAKSGQRNKYAFTVNGCGNRGGTSRVSKYQLTARPLLAGMPAFCSDESGVVRYDESGSVEKCLENGVPI
jgi:hypothetical protein